MGRTVGIHVWFDGDYNAEAAAQLFTAAAGCIAPARNVAAGGPHGRFLRLVVDQGGPHNPIRSDDLNSDDLDAVRTAVGSHIPSDCEYTLSSVYQLRIYRSERQGLEDD